MARITRKALHAFFAPHVKAAHRAVNEYCVMGMANKAFKATPGFVATHSGDKPPRAGVIEYEGYTLEISCCRRPRVVCNVPTPFSLYTFNYCLKRDGRQLAHGQTLPEFLDFAMRAIKRIEASAA
jgi:hypothetical protein